MDDEDFKEISRHKWCVMRTKKIDYAIRGIVTNNGKVERVWMHRTILGLIKGDGKQTDHINHNGLDNRKCNLRICTYSQNGQNRRKQRSSSKFKGVTRNKISKKWFAQIQINGKGKYLGSFIDEIDAAKVYDKAAKQLFGEFAQTNFN